MDSVCLTIDGRTATVPAGMTILEAADRIGIHIPNLCHDPRVEPSGSCRMCLVKVDGRPGMTVSCTAPATDGLVVTTDDEEISDTRRTILEMLLSEHRAACTTCDRDGTCRIQDYAYRYGAAEERYGPRPAPDSAPNFAGNNRGILHDASKCIKCGLCVRYCADVQMAEALTLASREDRIRVTTAFDRDLHTTNCELCGGCIRVCPAGALLDRNAVGKGRDRDLRRVPTVCSYCGVGCRMDLMVDVPKNRIVRVSAPLDAPVNSGNLCVKGHFGFEFVASSDRLTDPLVRRGDSFEKVSWPEALRATAEALCRIRDRDGARGLAFVSSCRCTNEENYLMQKLARAAGRTHNVDQCATTCHAPTVAGLASAFGSGAMTNSVIEVRDCDVMFVIGSNPTEAHPIIGLEMKKALRRGARLIVCDPRKTWMARRADVHLQLRPGSDGMLLNAMMRVIVEEGLHNREFVRDRCEDFEAFTENLKQTDIGEAAAYCGVSPDDLRRAARLYAGGNPSSIFYTLGITEHSCGTDNVKNLANLAMLCGQIGKWGSGVNPLRGQNNVQGGCDMGAMPHRLPGYLDWHLPEVRARYETLWGVPLPTEEGGRVTDFVEAAGAGVLKGLYVMGEDLLISEANRHLVEESLGKLEFLVCQDLFMNDTTRMAHVVLPGACWAEKDGTFTASERRVQRIRKAVQPPGQALADWEIICRVSAAMGYPMDYPDPSAIFDEMASLTPSYAGMSYARLGTQGLQWPCPTADSPGTRFLHQGTFSRGRGRFQPITFRAQKEEPDSEYPLILSTGRTLFNYNSGSMSRRVGIISQREKECFVEIHPQAAASLGIVSGAEVLVRTRRGRTTARAVVSDRTRPDSIWMPFHFAESPTNALTIDAYDPVTKTAEYKCCAAAVEVLS